jgi:L-lactate dehydrogenase complex protein LldG
VPDGAAAVAEVVRLVQARSARCVLLGGGAFIDTLPLAEALASAGVAVLPPGRESFFAADLGITGVDYLVAETGSIALLSGPDRPRSLSLLPPAHVAVAHRGQLLPDLFDLFEALPGLTPPGSPTPPGLPLPACLSLITGPSKTGDIELKLVTGVHGPGMVDVVLVSST